MKSKNKKYLPLGEAQELARSLKFKSIEEYRDYVRKNPNCGLPLDPEKIYGGKQPTKKDSL